MGRDYFDILIMKERNSNIELLRLFCIIAIVSMHVFGVFINNIDTYGRVAMIINNGLFNMCTSVFILISGYYGIRWNKEKLFNLWSIALFWSVVLIVVKSDYSAKYLLKSFFPVFTGKYWFLSSYIILFCVAPFVEDLISSLSKAQFRSLIAILLLFFYLAPTFLLFDIMHDSGKGVVNMMTVYLIGRYLSKYGFPKTIINIKIEWALPVSIITAILINLAVTLYTGVFWGMMSRDNSIMTLVGAISLLGIVLNIRPRSVRWINTLAGYVFPIYVIHYAFFPRYIYMPFSNTIPMYLMVWVNALYLSAISIILECLRRLLLAKPFEWCVRKEEMLVERLFSYVRNSDRQASIS